MQFSPSPRRTIGVEWELQLLDPETLDLIDGIVPLMEFFRQTEFVKPEFVQSCVELSTKICDDSGMAVEHLRQILRLLLQRSSELEMSVCGAGTHPFCRRLALITPFPRYQAMAKESGYVAHSQITFSTHVHVGMESGDQAINVMDRLIPALPAFIALSGNSPFWRGHQTGHASYRQRILAAARNYGYPPRFRDWNAFDRFLQVAKKGQLIKTLKDIHWHIRPHPDFGTLELRVMDSATRLASVHGLSAFARCLLLTLAATNDREIDGNLLGRLPDWIEQQNCFNAALHGLDANFVVRKDGTYRPLRDVVRDLIAYCTPIAQAINEEDGLAQATQMLNGVPQYQQQIDAYSTGNSARSVVDMLQRELATSVLEP